MRILRSGDHTRMPWKNGGGETTEIAVFPIAAGLDTFGWRISMATVARNGPFSSFSGVDRVLSILEGSGMILAIDGAPDVTVTTATAPLFFAADVATSARLIAGPIVDLNVMTRRGQWTATVERIDIVKDSEIVPSAEATPSDVTLVLALNPLTIDDGKQIHTLSRFDCAMQDDGFQLHGTNAATAFIIRLRRIANGLDQPSA